MRSSPARPADLADIFDQVEFRDLFRISFLANITVLPAYDAVARDFGLNRGEYLLLLCLSHMPTLTAQDIARVTGRPRNTISRAVHRMLEEGYIDRQPDPDDGRQARLSIRPKGRKLHEKIRSQFRESEAGLFGVLSTRERAQLDRLLDKLVGHAVADLI